MNPRLILWDIDGTLVRTGDFGAEVFEDAIERVLGVRPLKRPTFSGKTDLQITQEYLADQGSDDPMHASEVLRHVELGFARNIHRVKDEGYACAGVEEALQALASLPNVTQTVLTGNIPANARAKLSVFGLDRYLDLDAGTYGGDHADRRALLPIAFERQRELRGRAFIPSETWIVGDTTGDLACARAGNAHCLLVATGRAGYDELERLGADAVLADLSDTERVLACCLTSNPPGTTIRCLT